MRNNNHIYTIRLGVVIGIICSFAVFLISLLSQKNYGLTMFKMLEEGYPGCRNNDAKGITICTIFGFFDGFIFGVLIALLYNNIPINY